MGISSMQTYVERLSSDVSTDMIGVLETWNAVELKCKSMQCNIDDSVTCVSKVYSAWENVPDYDREWCHCGGPQAMFFGTDCSEIQQPSTSYYRCLRQGKNGGNCTQSEYIVMSTFLVVFSLVIGLIIGATLGRKKYLSKYGNLKTNNNGFYRGDDTSYYNTSSYAQNCPYEIEKTSKTVPQIMRAASSMSLDVSKNRNLHNNSLSTNNSSSNLLLMKNTKNLGSNSQLAYSAKSSLLKTQISNSSIQLKHHSIVSNKESEKTPIIEVTGIPSYSNLNFNAVDLHKMILPRSRSVSPFKFSSSYNRRPSHSDGELSRHLEENVDSSTESDRSEHKSILNVPKVNTNGILSH